MPSRKKKTAAPIAVGTTPRRSTRQAARSQNVDTKTGIPEIYQDMLAEAAAASDSDQFAPSPRPVKRRKVDVAETNEVDELFESSSPHPPQPERTPDKIESPMRHEQIVYDDFEGSDESDVEFEDVELELAADAMSDEEPPREIALQIDLSKPAEDEQKKAIQRRKPVSKEERAIRLDVHKWHYMSLVGHGLHRNSWCNDEHIHAIMKPLVSRKIIKLLHMDESKPLYERNHAFNKGVEEICALWRDEWKTMIPGLRRPFWRQEVDARDQADEGEDIDFDDFKSAAQTRRGSRDLGAQLFTALLRSIAVDTRLVFSMQVLPFMGAAKLETTSKPRAKTDYIQAPAQNYDVSAINTSPFAAPAVRPKKPKKIVDSPYPIFWVEVLSPSQTWIPLDPVVRNSIGKPKTQFEPPLSDELNNMTYVIAFEEDNTARDVTRRYAQWFNAKTRKLRIESAKNGDKWYELVMNVLGKKWRQPRDEIEDEELARRTNSEGMPNNIQDFKNHPVYVLERHMRANEVLQPKREVGKVNVGTTKNGKIESVYRRQDVRLCRSADAWYRRGKDVNVGEQPLKRIVPKSRRGVRGPSVEFSDDEEAGEGVGLYAEHQTSIYEPPPVADGQVPRNAYGNLDVYVPSMIPAGAIHISHSLAASAAKLLKVDFADAVTGFEFKGRQGTAIVNGVVIAEQFTAAVAATINGLETLGSEEVQQARSKILLNVWKRMLQSLRVRERVEAEYGPTGQATNESKQARDDGSDAEEDMDYEEDDDREGEGWEGGGFMLEAEPTAEKIQEQAVDLQVMKSNLTAILPDEVVSVPIKVTRSPHKPPKPEKNNKITITDNDDDNDLFEDDAPGGFMPEPTTNEAMLSNVEGGGFMQDEEVGGGFLPDDDDDDNNNNDNPSPPPDDSGGFIHSDAEEDSALQHAIAASLVSQPTQSAQAQSQSPAHQTRPPAPATEHVHPPQDQHAQKANTAAAPSTSPASTPESPSSLLSHDPAEDDDEPEWINDALDD